MAIGLALRDRSPGMDVVEILLVGKEKGGGMLSKSVWVFQGNQNDKKLKMISTEGIKTPGLPFMLFSLRKRQLFTNIEDAFPGLWKVSRTL